MHYPYISAESVNPLVDYNPQQSEKRHRESVCFDLSQKEELNARMLSALIAGVRRAFPYVSAESVDPLIDAHADSLFKLVHTRSFAVGTQALLLVHQLMAARNTVSDRFYR